VFDRYVCDARFLCFVFDCYVSDERSLCFVFVCHVSDARSLCFVFACYVSDARFLFFVCLIVTLVMSEVWNLTLEDENCCVWSGGEQKG